MTQKHFNECDRCGAHYNAIHPEEVVFMRLPNKIIPAAKTKGDKTTKPENSPLMLIPLPLIDTNNLLEHIQPKETEHTFVEFCPDCEISLIKWFDLEWLNNNDGDIYADNKHKKEYT